MGFQIPRGNIHKYNGRDDHGGCFTRSLYVVNFAFSGEEVLQYYPYTRTPKLIDS
jgi:hypothetical protein